MNDILFVDNFAAFSHVPGKIFANRKIISEYFDQQPQSTIYYKGSSYTKKQWDNKLKINPFS